MHRPIWIDEFAGGGGASLGIKRARGGRSPEICINHDINSIRMHEKNHPDSKHLHDSVWDVDIEEACGDHPVEGAWFSPDCKHFSRAKGAQPVEKGIRGLAWIVVKRAQVKRPRMIFLENVCEFLDWGPLIHALDLDGNLRFKPNGDPLMVPDPLRKGQTFKRWKTQLESLGYVLEIRKLNAKDYGANTSRLRLFIIGRCDGQPIAWPEPTHGPGRLPYRTAAECIDWTVPTNSIFDRKKALKPNTLRRLAQGIKRFVIDAASPFIVGLRGPTYSLDGRSVNRPLDAVMPGKTKHVVTPYLVKCNHTYDQFRGSAIDKPLHTITGRHGTALGVATLMQMGYGERKGQAARVPGLNKPLGTVVAGGCKHALIAASLTKFYGTCKHGQAVDAPTPTITGDGQHIGIAAAYLSVYYGSEADGQPLDSPLRTVTGRDRFALVVAFLREQKVIGEDELPIVHINGVAYVIVDIGMRMLTPRELARAQGFPDDYELTGSKANQVARIGNSVPPIMAEVLVRANLNPAARVAA